LQRSLGAPVAQRVESRRRLRRGGSDKSYDASSCAGSAMPLDVVAVLDELRIEHDAPSRFTALGIGAAAPDSTRSEDAGALLSLLEQGPAGMLTACPHRHALNGAERPRTPAVGVRNVVLTIAVACRRPGRRRLGVGWWAGGRELPVRTGGPL